jgi:hypothetical protein
MVRISERPKGWGYCVARNACFDHCTRFIPFMVYLDADWILRNNSLKFLKPYLHPDRIIQGWKHYAAPSRKHGSTRMYPEFAVIPLDSILTCGGMDEIFFPHYMGYWHDLMRRIQMVKKMEIMRSKLLFATDVGSEVKFARDANDGKDILRRVTAHNNLLPFKRHLFHVDLVWSKGYEQ